MSKDITPIFLKSISAGTRIYYIDVHVDAKGQHFMSISEIPAKKFPGKKNRQRIFLHAQNISRFEEALSEVLSFIKNENKR